MSQNDLEIHVQNAEREGEKTLVFKHHFSIRPIPVFVLSRNDTTGKPSTAEDTSKRISFHDLCVIPDCKMFLISRSLIYSPPNNFSICTFLI